MPKNPCIMPESLATVLGEQDDDIERGRRPPDVDDDASSWDVASSFVMLRCYSTWRRTIIISLIALLGGMSSLAVLAVGMEGVTIAEKVKFESRAEWIQRDISATFQTLERVALMFQASFANSNCNAEHFRSLYDHATSINLPFDSMMLLKNISHDERSELESETNAYLGAKGFPQEKYQGITVQDEETGMFYSQSQRDFYFPIHFVEPMQNHSALLDLDLYETHSDALNKTIHDMRPSLTFQDNGSLLLLHPGILPNSGFVIGVSLGVDELLSSVLANAQDEITVYLYDHEMFLGGQIVRQDRHGTHRDPPEPISFEKLYANRLEESRYFETSFEILSREWTMVVVSSDSDYEPAVIPVICGAALIALATLILAVWFHTHLRRMTEDVKLRSRIQSSKAREALKQTRRERYLNDFIAHEVRNPLACAITALSFVSGSVRQSIREIDVQKSVLDDVQIIESSLQYINDLLRNMLDMHRDASCQFKTDYKLTAIKQDILQPAAAILHFRGVMVDIRIECDEDLAVKTDRLRLKQIILNLALNSLKFVEKGFILLRAEVVDGNVRLLVEDSGPGIPEEKGGNLFTKFQESLDLLNQGTGIGLFICKQLITLMDGEIWHDPTYESELHGCPGTRFIIDLKQPPVEVEGTSNFEVSSSDLVVKTTTLSTRSSFSMIEEQHLPDKMRVLFVDDDVVLRKLFRRNLQRVCPDWEIVEAANGETALQITETKEFDLIFMDQYMTSIEKSLLGSETVRALRCRGVSSIICGLSANDVQELYFNAGADAFMFKPFPTKPDVLRKELIRVVEKRSVGAAETIAAKTA